MEKANDIFPVKDEPRIDWIYKNYFIKLRLHNFELIMCHSTTVYRGLAAGAKLALFRESLCFQVLDQLFTVKVPYANRLLDFF